MFVYPPICRLGLQQSGPSEPLVGARDNLVAPYPELLANGFRSRFCRDCREQENRHFENLKQCTARTGSGIVWEPVPAEELTTDLARSLEEMNREGSQCEWCWNRGSWGRHVRLCVLNQHLLGPALGDSQESKQPFLVDYIVESIWRAAGGQVVNCKESCTHLVLDYPAESGMESDGFMRTHLLSDGSVVGAIPIPLRPLILHHAES